MEKITQFNNHIEKKWYENFKFSIREIVFIGIFLAILIIAKTFELLIPSLPLGGSLGNFNQMILLLGSLLFGFKIAFSTNLIYLLVFCTTFPAVFANGFLGIRQFDKVVGIYFLDYFLPLSILTLAGLFYKKNIKTKIFSTIFFVFISLIFHVISGYVFLSTFNPNPNENSILVDLGANIYVWTYNVVALSVLFVFSIPIVIAADKIQPIFLTKFLEKSIWN